MDKGTTTEHQGERELALEEWQRFQYAVDAGHADFVGEARRNYRYYRGNGGQWADDDRTFMESVQGRKCIEVNEILPAVNTAVGEQIASRTDIGFKPSKGRASAETAAVISKLVKHVLDRNGYKRREKQVYKNGMIKKRGYFDIRMEYDGNLNGEIVVRDLDPLGVIPDPHAESYDPKEWGEVTLLRWLSLDQIEGLYGKEARIKVEKNHQEGSDSPWGEEYPSTNALDSRQGFSNAKNFIEAHKDDLGTRHYRIVERQFYRYGFHLAYVDPETGDIEAVPESATKEEIAAYSQQNGYLLQKMNLRKLHWRVSTQFTILHDEPSPYRTMTVIPFFYLFDYGDTMAMLDNLIGPQDLENKSLSSFLHILVTTSNSGWKVPRDGDKSALMNMTTRELAEKGMKTGLVIEYDKSIGEPEKIQPNQVPTGFDRLIDRGSLSIKSVSGMSDAEQGLRSPEVSGVAISAKQFQAKLQLADPLDNLEATRQMVGRKVLELIQDFFVAEQVFKIAGIDPKTGQPTEEELIINQVDPYGRVLNDVTVGEYEVAVTTSPLSATHEESQFQQALSLRRDAGVAIPDDEMVRRSLLADKYELAERLANVEDDGVARAQMQKLMADIKLIEAKRLSEVARATNTNVQALFGSVNAGRELALTPSIAPLADELAKSAGFEDRNEAPLIPESEGMPGISGIKGTPIETVPSNTSPNFPPQADSGYNAGIEGGQ